MRLALITGGAGQLGTELQRCDWGDRWTVVAPSAEELNLLDSRAIAAYVASRRWDVVINCAAYTAVDSAECNVLLAWQLNALAPAAFAVATAAAGIPIIQISTDYVFAGTAAGAYAADAPIGPLNVYGASKEGGEQAVRTGNPRHAIIRTSWVVSAHRKNFVKTMLCASSGGREIKVVSDQFGAPTAAADLAMATATVAMRLVEDCETPAGTWHFCNAGRTDWHGVATEIVAQAALRGRPKVPVKAIKADEYSSLAQRPTNSMLDCKTFTRDFGIVPRTWQSALSEILDELVGEKI